MRYQLSFSRASSQLIDIQVETLGEASPLLLELSRWRPGRYEAQRYARNIADVRAHNVQGEEIAVEKLGSHTWQVNAPAKQKVVISYTYYAKQADAGGSYVDADGIYINPINLLLFRPERIQQPCEMQLNIPESYTIACGLPQENGVLQAKNFHELADSPLFAAATLQHHAFVVQSVKTNIWFMGDCRPDFEQIELDFRAYTEQQIAVFGGFPVAEYHYLCLILHDRFRHGVEHQTSTVIAMGPGYELHEPRFYRSFLELCSHELFHTWNVKAIRPKDMLPYDYTQEQYSQLHYVTEGITTYYGDLMLWKSGLWDDATWLTSLNGELDLFYRYGGKDKVSLEESSVDSWVRGYSNDGIPNQRVSFYTKGYLVAMIMDMEIRKATHDKASLDTVMRQMYEKFGKTSVGYTADDVRTIVENISGISFREFWQQYISGTASLEPALRELCDYYGFIYQETYLRHSLALYGIKATSSGIIENILPNSPAEIAGLAKGDEIIAIANVKAEGNLNDLLAYYGEAGSVSVQYFHQKVLKTTNLQRAEQFRVMIPQVSLAQQPTDEQLNRRNAWRTVSVGQLADVLA